MIKIISSERWDGDGRAFGTKTKPITLLIVCLTTDGTLPYTYSDIQGLDECIFAPGSICMDTMNKKTYIYDGTIFKQWS